TEGLIDLLIDLVPAEIVREEMAAIFLRPVVSQVNHRADVRVAAIDGITAARARATGAMIVTRGREQVVAELRERFGRIRDNEWRIVPVHLVPELAALQDVGGRAFAVVAAAVRHEKLAVFVIVETPGIAAAVRKDLELAPHRMIAPHAGAQLGPLRGRHAGR